jgi:hypothetical protein
LRCGELAQVRVGDPGAPGDLSEGEVGRLVAIVGDADADAACGCDLEAGGCHAHDLVAGLIALDGGDDFRGTAGAFVDLALKDAAVSRCVRAVIGEPGRDRGHGLERCVGDGLVVWMSRRTWVVSL